MGKIQPYTSKAVQIPPAARTLATLVKTVAAVIAVCLVVALGLLVHLGQVQDRTAIDAAEQQYRGLHSLLVRQLSTHVRDYTYWNEAIERLLVDHDEEWWDLNAGSYAVEAFSLSFSLAVDGADRLRFVTTPEDTITDMPITVLTPSLRALLAEARARPLSASADEAVATGIVDFDGELHLAAATLFLPDTDDMVNPDPRALLAYAQPVDAILAEIGTIMGSPDLRQFEETPPRAAAVALRLADGSSAGVVAWTPPRPGRSVTAGVIPLVSAAFLFVLALVAFFAFRARRLAVELYADERTRQDLAIRNQSILEAAGEGIFGVDATATTVFANSAALHTIGYTFDEFIGRDPHPLIQCKLTDRSRDPVETCPVRRTLADGSPSTSDAEVFARKDGTTFPVEFLVTPMRRDDRVMGAVVVFRDITHRRRTEEAIRYHANFDALTGLPNRNLLMERISQELKRARRENTTVGLLFLDLDHFKAVNDALGHEAGDLLLRQAGERLHGCIRETDTVGRLGGDEFVILLPQLQDAATAALIGDKVISALSERFNLDEQNAWVGASIGITIFPGDGENVNELLRNADLAMYKAKEAGRNTYRFYKSAMTDYVLKRRGLEMDLRQAIADNELVLFYQPIVTLDNGRTAYLEALVRWRHPLQGLLKPSDFIPLAEETGLIAQVGEWVINECCRQIAAWRATGRDIEVAINVSGRQIPRDLPAEMFTATLEKHGVPPSALMVEITETVILGDTTPVKAWLDTVRAIGIRLIIDDFGTGYSSLSHLKYFSLEALKIDQSLISGLMQHREDQALVTTILAMAHGLGLPAVAEGVETEAQREWLRAHGCDCAQGYLFARPAEAGEIR